MTYAEVIRAAIPGASGEFCEYIMWECTAFPFRPYSARELYKIASKVRRASKAKRQLCDCCGNWARNEKSVCESCRVRIDEAAA